MTESEQPYMWRDVLCDRNCGMAVILAESKQDAFRKIREDDSIPRHVRDELLTNEPEPLDSDSVEWVHGGA